MTITELKERLIFIHGRLHCTMNFVGDTSYSVEMGEIIDEMQEILDKFNRIEQLAFLVKPIESE